MVETKNKEVKNPLTNNQINIIVSVVFTTIVLIIFFYMVFKGTQGIEMNVFNTLELMGYLLALIPFTLFTFRMGQMITSVLRHTLLLLKTNRLRLAELERLTADQEQELKQYREMDK